MMQVLICSVLTAALCGTAEGQEYSVTIVPIPKNVEFGSGSRHTLGEGTTAIVLGAAASRPETYAAETLRDTVQRRFGQTWPIVREDEPLEEFDTLVVLGQNGSCQLLESTAAGWGIDTKPSALRHDGYAIRMGYGRSPAGQEAGPPAARTSSAFLVVIAGNNPRAVIFGQDTLFQLLSAGPNGLALARAAVDDWPDIPWRGKPQTQVSAHLEPGMADAYARARFNFTDLRNGIYAFEPEDVIDEDLVTRAIDECHRRGMIVYASVNCGVDRSRYDAIIEKFERFISLGADGLWVSFDDKGQGELPEELLPRVLALGARHGITGSLIAVCPPKGAYQMVESESTRRMLRVPGMEDALWFFTSIPSEGELAAARRIGMRSRPGWWHNWPRFVGAACLDRCVRPFGLLYGGLPRKAGAPYLPVPTLAEGWHGPTYEELACAGHTTSAVMQWGGSAWNREYTYPVLGWWAWDPARHDWDQARGRIYDMVFGAARVEAARRFDDSMRGIYDLVTVPGSGHETEPRFPPRLVRLEDRPTAKQLVSKAEEAFDRLRSVTPEESFVGPERLASRFVDPMRAEVDTARAVVELDFPEYWWDDHQRRLLNLIYDGRTDEADLVIREAAPRIASEVEQVTARLTEIGGMDQYAQKWAQRAGRDAAGWLKLLSDRGPALVKRMDDLIYFKIGEPRDTYLRGRVTPPRARVLAPVEPGQREHFSGAWLGGHYAKSEVDCYVFTYPVGEFAHIGEYGEIDLTLPSTHARPTPASSRLQFYISSWTNDTIGYQKKRDRWAGRNYVELRSGDRTVWERDVVDIAFGGEWITVDVPDHGALALRVETRQESDGCGTVVFVGPLRLIAAE